MSDMIKDSNLCGQHWSKYKLKHINDKNILIIYYQK